MLIGIAAISRAGLNMNLHMYNYGDGYFAFPELSTNGVTSNPANTAYFAWGPNSTMTSGIHYELHPNNSISGGSSGFGTYEDFAQAINGNWTLLVTNTTSTNQYTFTVDISAIGSNSFPAIAINYPTNGATGVAHEPLFAWTGPIGWQGLLNVHVRKDGSYFHGSNLPTSATSWPCPEPLNNGTNIFRPSYVTNVTSLIPISTPIDGSSNELVGWVGTAMVEGFRDSTFSVGSTVNNNGGHTLIAHYAFEDDTVLTEDISGHGNDIEGSFSFGCGDLETTDDAKAGDFAANFYTEDGDCPVWLNPPTNLVSTLAGSFTVSLWLKTSDVYGEDDDSEFSAAGIVSAFNGDYDTAVMPMGLTGSKLAFHTGGDNPETLYSQTSINTDDYVHLVVTRNQTTGEKKIYIDGTLDISDIASTDLLNGAEELNIGYNNGNGFDGNLDDIQIYSGVLSPVEVTYLFNNPGSSVPDVIVGHLNLAHYTFNQSGDLGQDSSIQGGGDINSGCSWGTPGHQFSTNSISGAGAIQFYGVSSLCIFTNSPAYPNWSTALGASFTFSTWVKTTNSKGDEFDNAFSGASIFWAYNGGGNTNDTIPISLTDGKVAFTTRGQGSSDTLHSTSRVNDGTYHHIAVTRSYLTGEKKIYVDGQFQTNQIGTTQPLKSANHYSIGGDAYWIDGSGTNFSSYIGLLDDAQVYAGVLSESEIATLYNNPGTTIPDGGDDELTLAQAVNAPQFFWTTGGDANWFAQTNTTYNNDVAAAQGGEIVENEESWIQTTVNGPATIGFWWKMTDDSCIAQYSFSVDGSGEAYMFCSSDWEYETIEIPPGAHTLEWKYSKYFLQDPGPAAGQAVPQGAWLDQFTFSDQVSPHITSTPFGATGFTGTNISLTVGYYANPQPVFTWYRNNVPVPGQTTATLSINNAQPSNSGFYYLSASNYLGTDFSDTFSVNIYDPTDLRPLSLNAPLIIGSQTLVPISWSVTNTGPGTVSNSFFDHVFLYTNDTHISFVTALLHNPPFGPGATYSVNVTNRFPNIIGGDYSLKLFVDNFGNQLEVNETNNALTIPITIVNPDMQPGALQAPAIGVGGRALQIIYNITNNGPANLDGASWNDQLFLSQDDQFDVGDINLAQFFLSPQIAVGQHVSRTNTITLPVVPSGNYYLILQVDNFGSLWESNETNNQIVLPIQMTTPDLTPVNLAAPSEASTRQPIQITWSIQNIGDGLAQKKQTFHPSEWDDRIYLSTNSVVNGASIRLGQFSGASYQGQDYAWQTPLPAGQTMTNTQTIHIPNVAEGNYFLVLTNDVDNYVTEFRETNNSISIPILIANPDLVVTNITAPATADSQSVIPVIWEVHNQGLGTAYPSWTDRVYLSVNNTYETNDTFLGQFQKNQIVGSGSNYFGTNFVSVPGVAPGNYFFIVRTDTATNLFESDRTNNVRATPINLASPDLAVAKVNTLTNLASQQAVNITFVVTNLGGTTALPSWADRLWLSTNATLEAGDLPINSTGGGIDFVINTQLPVSGSYTQQVDVRIPAVNAGNYFLLVQTDSTGSFTEINEANNVFATAIHLTNPDLTPTNFLAPASITITQLNQRIEVGWNVLNQGGGTAHVGWTDYLYISPTNVLNGSAVFIGSENPSVPLPAGQSYLAFNNPTLPNGIQGNYFLILSADAPNQLFESSETNNVSVRPLEIVIPPLADLSLTEVSGPVETFSGQEIEITWVLTNSGNASVTRPFREQLFLATAANGSGATFFGTFDFTGTIAPGASVERIQRITLPISMSGLRWPVVVTDSNNEIFEFNRENNNSLVSAQPIDVKLSPFPNLTVTNINSATNVFSGQQTVVSWAVTNQGIGPTSSPYWYDSVLLSTDAAVGNDTLLANVANVSYLNPGESYVSSATVNLPRGIQGTYYFIIRCDGGNYVFESTFENDNVTVSPSFFIDLTPPPDLRVDSVIPPLNAFSGQPVSVSWGVTNAGQGQTVESSWSDRVFLSADTNLDGGDHSLGAFHHSGGMEPGQNYRVTNSVTLPVGISGDYYFIVLADGFGNVFEVPFEGNNTRAANSITAVSLTPPPDLETAIQLSPTNALSSHLLSVRYRVVNNGATATPNSSWTDRLFISTNPVPSASDLTLVFANHYGALAVGASYTNTFNVTLSDTLTGTYYIFVRADAHDAVFELDNTNNTVVASNTVVIISRPADLAVRLLQAPSAAEAGNAMFVSWAVTNLGSGDSAVTRWTDRLILSADDFVGDSDDITLRDRPHDGLLNIAGEYSVSNEVASIPISVSPGTYRLFLVTDRYSEVYESNETNNVFGPVNVTITRDTADLQITNVIAPPGGISGANFTVQWVARNFGTRAPNSSSWVDGIYLSADMLLSPSDLLLGRRQNFSQLAPGQTYTNALTATLPPNLQGNYFIIVVVDEFNQVVEAGLDGNNTFISTPSVPIVLSPVPDLAVTVNAPAEAFSGQIFDLSWTVQNVGTAAANGNWYEAAYLSLDHFLDPFTDIYLGFDSRVQNLAPNESYVNSNSFEIPQGLSGPYYVFVSTDTGGQIFERGSENNNIEFDPQAMLIELTPPVDLVAGPITIPANAVPGVNATIVYTVFNYGSNTARGSWEDAIYISADTNFDAGDALMGRARHTGNVLPGSGYTNSLTAPLPGVLPGDYTVIIRSDILNHIPESNETNNLGASINSVSIDAEELILGTADTGTIAQGQSVFYKFNAVAGQTVRIRFTTGVALAGNEVFVRYANMPNRGQFDFAINEPFVSDPDIFIPIENTGTHYLLVYCSSMPLPASYTILAEVLPFSVATIFPNVAGDQGETTFKIKGALFDDDTKFQLVKGTNKITAARFSLDDSSTAYVTFNLLSVENGPWNLKAFMNSTSIVSSTLSNAVTVTSGGGGVISFAIDGPLAVWAVFTQRILLFYGNEGNSDAEAPLLLIEGRDGTRVGADVNVLQTNVLQILGRSLDGPVETLRPQSSYSHTAYYRGGALHVEGRTVSTSDMHLVTDDDWLEIESSVRPAGSADVDWLPFWANIRPRIGATWGDYVKFLNRFAEPFPAEQRDVRKMFTHYLTNQPGFRASSSFSGTLLGSTNDLPQAGVEIGLFLTNASGAGALVGRTVTDSAGQFVFPYLPAGQYACSITNSQFDMDRDGEADTNGLTITIQTGSDLLNQSIYRYQAPVITLAAHDSDATMIVDAQGVLHTLWYRDEQLWHARYDNGQWVDAESFGFKVIGGFAVGASANLVDGQSPGIIVVWSQLLSNTVELLYSVGQSGSGGFSWSQPVQLTDDQVQNTSPAINVGDDGKAVVTYLQRGIGFQDDTDVYFATINVASGALLDNTARVITSDFGLKVPSAGDVTVPLTLSLTHEHTFSWPILSYTFGLGYSFTAEGNITGCEASIKGAAGIKASIDAPDANLTVGGGVEGSFAWRINPDLCTWEFNNSSLNLNGTFTFDQKNAIPRILQAIPTVPTKAAAASLNKMTDFLRGWGLIIENTMGVTAGVTLNGLTWNQEPAPLTGFRLPDSYDTADFTFGLSAVVSARTLAKNEEVVNDLPAAYVYVSDEPGGGNSQAAGTIKGTVVFQILPEVEYKSAVFAGELKFTIPPIFSVNLALNINHPGAADVRDSDAKKEGDENFPEGWTFNYDPAQFVGTTNTSGTNPVLSNVAGDLYQDGAPALAADNTGGVYQIWSKSGDPYSGQPGSQLFVADFNGTNWNAPTTIPGTLGFNSYISAARDLLGRRLAVWVHSDASSLTTNSTAEQLFALRKAAEVYYSSFDGAAWSVPQPVALTAGPDTEVQLSRMSNGNVLAVWTFVDTNTVVHLMAAYWNGSTWTAAQEITAGSIISPAAQQVGNVIHLMWTQVVGTNNNSRQEALFQSRNVAGVWSAPELFDPTPSASSFVRAQSKPLPIAKADNNLEAIQRVTQKQEDSCCKCKGRLTSAPPTGTPTTCGTAFSGYDYVKCLKKFTYKACPLVSMDPNDIVGPEGFGPERWVGVNAPLNYIIHFENDALLANAPAKQVIITLPMDEDFDARTFRLGNFGFGDITVDVPPNQAFYSTRLDLTATRGFYLDFFAGVDVAKREAFWRLITVDPATGALPINPQLGFLPPNVTSPEGEGFVSFSLKPNVSTANGARADAKATIVFDTQPPIDTPPIFNSVETSIPVSAVSSLPPVTNIREFNVSWSGNDGTGGSGIATYDVFASENGGEYFLLAEATTLASTPFVGDYGNRYAFYSIAHDNAGNAEAAPLLPDAEILVATSNTPPTLLNFTNAQVMEKTLFTRQIEATDADLPTNVLTFALLNGLPGMSLNPTNGLFSWIPNESQGPNTNVITIQVSDDATPALSTTNSFTITILESNEPPAFLNAAEYTVDEMTALTFTNVAVDPDIPTNNVTLQLVSAPAGVAFDDATGIITWTPGETNGPATNQIIVSATDDATPAASSFRTNTIIVREANIAPVLDLITNRVTLPLSLVRIEFDATDSDVPTNNLTFSLGSGSPGVVNSQTGVFRWRPGLEFGGTSNLVTAIVTDDGTPSLSATQQFVIMVEDFVRIELGEAALFVNQTSSVPIKAISSAPWRTMNFTLQLPTNILGEIALNNIVAPSTAAAVVQMDAVHAQITFSNAPGQALQGTQQLARLSFKAIATNSAILNLVPANQNTTGTNGQSITHLLDSAGRITIIGERPVLDAFSLVGNRHSLVLFGNPGQTYLLETTTNMTEISWDFFTNVTLTNIFQPVEGRTNSSLLFYRARQ